MKNEISSNNVFLKSLSLYILMLFSINVMSQELTFDMGSGDINVYFSKLGIIGHSANKLKFIEYNAEGNDVVYEYCCPNYKEGAINEVNFTTSHGNYIEYLNVEDYNKDSYVNKINKVLVPSIVWMVSSEMGEETIYSIVQNGSNLYVVSVVNDKIINTLTTNFTKANDFKIIKDGASLFIINNGKINWYKKYKSSSPSSVSSTKTDISETKTYSLGGIQVNSPHNGIFIKGGKKVIIK